METEHYRIRKHSSEMCSNSKYNKEMKDGCVNDAVNSVAWRQQYHDNNNKLCIGNQQPHERDTDNSARILHNPQSTAFGPWHAKPVPESSAVNLRYVVTDHHLIITQHHHMCVNTSWLVITYNINTLSTSIFLYILLDSGDLHSETHAHCPRFLTKRIQQRKLLVLCIQGNEIFIFRVKLNRHTA